MKIQMKLSKLSKIKFIIIMFVVMCIFSSCPSIKPKETDGIDISIPIPTSTSTPKPTDTIIKKYDVTDIKTIKEDILFAIKADFWYDGIGQFWYDEFNDKFGHYKLYYNPFIGELYMVKPEKFGNFYIWHNFYLEENGRISSALGMLNDWSHVTSTALEQHYNLLRVFHEFPVICLDEGVININRNEITAPGYPEPSTEWITNVTRCLKEAMDINDFYINDYITSEDSNKLDEGKYDVYVQRIRETDTDGIVIFINNTTGKTMFANVYYEESGKLWVYRVTGSYYFSQEYVDKIKQDHAVHFKYNITKKTSESDTDSDDDIVDYTDYVRRNEGFAEDGFYTFYSGRYRICYDDFIFDGTLGLRNYLNCYINSQSTDVTINSIEDTFGVIPFDNLNKELLSKTYDTNSIIIEETSVLGLPSKRVQGRFIDPTIDSAEYPFVYNYFIKDVDSIYLISGYGESEEDVIHYVDKLVATMERIPSDSE